MPKYKCKRCKKTFTRKESLKRHASLSCRFLDAKEIERFTCVFCGKSFGRKDNLNKHVNLNRCPNDPYVDLKIINFCEEDVSSSVLKNTLNAKGDILLNFIINVHFDPMSPRYHNIYYGSITSPYGKIYKDGIWVSRYMYDIIDTLINVKWLYLEKMLRSKRFDRAEKDKIKRSLHAADYMQRESRKTLKKNLRVKLFQNREIIRDTIRTIKRRSKIKIS